MEIIWIILLIINFLLYGACCFGVLKRKTFTSISIRSPRLLILNNIGNFFMTLIIILTAALEGDGKKICSLFYYLTNFLVIIPFCLRFRRIANCCEIKINERFEIQENTPKHKNLEKYNIRLFIIIFVLLTIVLLVSNAIVTRSEAITAIFLYEPDDGKLYDANKIIWLVINFFEHILLLRYAYYICVNKIKQKLRFEIVVTFLVWFIYCNLISILEINSENINHEKYIIYISLAVCYIFLIINTIIPIGISFYHSSTIYSFTPKLMNNLYLFLTNETCYMYFKEYLNTGNENNRNANNLLKLYTDIIDFKLGYKLKISNELGFEDASNIKNEFFGTHNNAHLPENVLEKVKKDCQGLENNSFSENMFDEALKYCFNELEKIFNNFKKSNTFKELYKEYFLTTYIQCRMCNVGLINKF